MGKWWFKSDDHPDGERTLEEQMMGLDPVLAVAKGSTVLDLGCAEGLIAEQMLVSGAKLVHGVETNFDLMSYGMERLSSYGDRMWFHRFNLNLPLSHDDGLMLSQYDITLMLAILHKLHDPEPRLIEWASRTRKRIAIRAPVGQVEVIVSNHGAEDGRQATCNVPTVMKRCGFVLDCVIPGPRGEPVQHWVRK